VSARSRARADHLALHPRGKLEALFDGAPDHSIELANAERAGLLRRRRRRRKLGRKIEGEGQRRASLVDVLLRVVNL
jgi:hypothetical protein